MDIEDRNKVLRDVALDVPVKDSKLVYDADMLQYRKEVEAWYADLLKRDPGAAIDIREP